MDSICDFIAPMAMMACIPSKTEAESLASPIP